MRKFLLFIFCFISVAANAQIGFLNSNQVMQARTTARFTNAGPNFLSTNGFQITIWINTNATAGGSATNAQPPSAILTNLANQIVYQLATNAPVDGYVLTATGNQAAWVPSAGGVATNAIASTNGTGTGTTIIDGTITNATITGGSAIPWINDTEQGIVILVPDQQDMADGTATMSLLNDGASYVTNLYAMGEAGLGPRVKAVVGLGDLVNGASNTEFTNVMQRFWKPVADYCTNAQIMPTVGNHDYAGNAQIGYRDLTNYNAVFSNFFITNRAGFSGGFMTNGLTENMWSQFYIGTNKYMVFSLEFGPRDSVLSWVAGILATNRTATAMLATHAHLRSNNQRHGDASFDGWANYVPTTVYSSVADGNNGNQVWAKLVWKNPNVRFIHSGHELGAGVAHRVGQNTYGGTVTETLFNSQTNTSAGDRISQGMLVVQTLGKGRSTFAVWQPNEPSSNAPSSSANYNFSVAVEESTADAQKAFRNFVQITVDDSIGSTNPVTAATGSATRPWAWLELLRESGGYRSNAWFWTMDLSNNMRFVYGTKGHPADTANSTVATFGTDGTVTIPGLSSGASLTSNDWRTVVFRLPLDGAFALNDLRTTKAPTNTVAGQRVGGITGDAFITTTGLTYPWAPPLSNNFSGSYWFQKDNTNDIGAVGYGNGIGQFSAGGSGTWALGFLANNTIRFPFITNSVRGNVDWTNPKICDGQWHNIAFTFNTTAGLILFFDGVPVLTNAIPTAFTGPGTFPISVGNTLPSNNHTLIGGAIDEPQIWNVTLSASEVAENYRRLRGFTARDNRSQLVFRTTFDDKLGPFVDEVSKTPLWSDIGQTNLLPSFPLELTDYDGYAVKLSAGRSMVSRAAPNISTGLTSAVWFKSDPANQFTTSAAFLMLSQHIGGTNGSWYFGMSTTDPTKLRFASVTNTANPARVDTDVSLPYAITNGAWHHLALSWSTNQGAVFYLNGQPFATNTDIVTPLQDSTPFPVGIAGGSTGGANLITNAFLDEATIYSRALSQSEIVELAGPRLRLSTNYVGNQVVNGSLTVTGTISGNGIQPTNNNLTILAGARAAGLVVTNVVIVETNNTSSAGIVGGVLTILNQVGAGGSGVTSLVYGETNNTGSAGVSGSVGTILVNTNFDTVIARNAAIADATNKFYLNISNNIGYDYALLVPASQLTNYIADAAFAERDINGTNAIRFISFQNLPPAGKKMFVGYTITNFSGANITLAFTNPANWVAYNTNYPSTITNGKTARVVFEVTSDFVRYGVTVQP